MAPQEKKKGKEPAKEEPEEESEESEEEDSEEESDSEDEVDLDGSSDDEEEIMVDFEFQDPTEIDFHGLKALLGNYLDGAEFSSSPLCDAIIAQKTVGTVIKAQGAGDEMDPVAVMSVMNIQDKKDTAYIKEIAAYLKNRCPKDLKDKLNEAFNSKGVGFLLNERVINIPPETASPLVEGLFDEIGWATEDEPTQELRESFKFSKYLIFSRLYRDDEPEEEAGQKRKRDGEPMMMYTRPEDEFFHQSCEWSFMWKVKDAEDKSDIQDIKPMRLCMFVDARVVPEVREKLKKQFGAAA
ncbi:BCIP domain-containing protein [bacterium]|nr:BCIP domain-containing protein [bacterium]